MGSDLLFVSGILYLNGEEPDLYTPDFSSKASFFSLFGLYLLRRLPHNHGLSL